MSSKHTHMYQPGKQAKEASVIIAAQQHCAIHQSNSRQQPKWHVLLRPVHPKVLTQGGRSPVAGVSRLAMCACLAVSVFPGRLILVPRVASRVTLAVRADARDVIYISCGGRRSVYARR